MRVRACCLAALAGGAALPVPTAHARQARAGERADYGLIDKSERKLWVEQGERAIRTYSGLQ